MCSLLPCFIATSSAQLGNVIGYTPPQRVTVKAGAPVDSALKLNLKQGFHVNSSTPSEDYLIPLKLTWNEGALEAAGTTFPKPEYHKYSFAQMPLSVYTGDFEIVTHFKAKAKPGVSSMTGKLRYQACNDNMCLPPKTLEVKVDVEVQ